jgi:hypothetical protein
LLTDSYWLAHGLQSSLFLTCIHISFPLMAYPSILKMEALCTSKTMVYGILSQKTVMLIALLWEPQISY